MFVEPAAHAAEQHSGASGHLAALGAGDCYGAVWPVLPGGVPAGFRCGGLGRFWAALHFCAVAGSEPFGTGTGLPQVYPKRTFLHRGGAGVFGAGGMSLQNAAPAVGDGLQGAGRKSGLLLHRHRRARTGGGLHRSQGHEGLSFAKDILKENHLPQRVLVVSDRYHLFRCSRILEKLGLSCACLPCPINPVVAFGYWFRECVALPFRLQRKGRKHP